MANSKRKCPACKSYNKVEDGKLINNRLFCNLECAIGYGRRNAPKAKAKTEKAERVAIQERKKALRPRSWYLKETQKWFNKFIRLRDRGKPCCS